MSKELPYFKFNVPDWIIGNIQLCSYEVKGIFIDICAFYWRNDCDITIQDLEVLIKASKQCFSNARSMLQAKSIIAINDKEKVSIKFLDKQFKERIESHQKRVNAGSKGGKAKALNSSPSNALALLEHTVSNSNSNNFNSLIEDIFLAYPKQANEVQGLRSIARAVKKIDHIELLAKVKEFAMAIDWQEPAFIPNADKWFDLERWKDDPKTWQEPQGKKENGQKETFKKDEYKRGAF